MSEQKFFYGNGVVAETGSHSINLDTDELYDLICAEVAGSRDQDAGSPYAQRAALNKTMLGVPP
ncbi:MAG TPA: hypothetical protein VF762_15205, partial [Blastocatellia bacterium]